MKRKILGLMVALVVNVGFCGQGIELPMKSAADYIYTVPNCTNLIRGIGMGEKESSAYKTLRAEDIAAHREMFTENAIDLGIITYVDDRANRELLGINEEKEKEMPVSRDASGREFRAPFTMLEDSYTITPGKLLDTWYYKRKKVGFNNYIITNSSPEIGHWYVLPDGATFGARDGIGEDDVPYRLLMTRGNPINSMVREQMEPSDLPDEIILKEGTCPALSNILHAYGIDMKYTGDTVFSANTNIFDRSYESVGDTRFIDFISKVTKKTWEHHEFVDNITGERHVRETNETVTVTSTNGVFYACDSSTWNNKETHYQGDDKGVWTDSERIRQENRYQELKEVEALVPDIAPYKLKYLLNTNNITAIDVLCYVLLNVCVPTNMGFSMYTPAKYIPTQGDWQSITEWHSLKEETGYNPSTSPDHYYMITLTTKAQKQNDGWYVYLDITNAIKGLTQTIKNYPMVNYEAKMQEGGVQTWRKEEGGDTKIETSQHYSNSYETRISVQMVLRTYLPIIRRKTWAKRIKYRSKEKDKSLTDNGNTLSPSPFPVGK